MIITNHTIKCGQPIIVLSQSFSHIVLRFRAKINSKIYKIIFSKASKVLRVNNADINAFRIGKWNKYLNSKQMITRPIKVWTPKGSGKILTRYEIITEIRVASNKFF